MDLLKVTDVNSFYGDSHILFDVSMRVAAHEVVALLGRNGAGKSTTLKTIAGVLNPRSGQIEFDGTPIAQAKPFEIANLGLQLVPEERRIVGGLTVLENLELATLSASDPWSLDRIFSIFPRLKQREQSRGRDLSGGEQQMLAIARALIRNAKLILLDEPFEGLAPVIVEDLLDVCQKLAAEGQTFVVVEQNVAAALSFADRCYIIRNGSIVGEYTAAQLQEKPQIVHEFLAV